MVVHTFQFSRSLRTQKHSTQSRSSAPTEQFSTRRSLSASGGQFFIYLYPDIFISIQILYFYSVGFDSLSMTTTSYYCIKYNRSSNYAARQFSNTPILQRWWWCVVKSMKFSILSPINISTVWMVVITQMKKIIKKCQMIKKRRCGLCTRSLNTRILFPKMCRNCRGGVRKGWILEARTGRGAVDD